MRSFFKEQSIDREIDRLKDSPENGTKFHNIHIDQFAVGYQFNPIQSKKTYTQSFGDDGNLMMSRYSYINGTQKA